MSRINDILVEVLGRASAIAGVKTSVKRFRTFHASELPGICVYREPSITNESLIALRQVGRGRYEATVPIRVDYHATSITDDPAAEAEVMIESMLAVIETAIPDLGGLLCEPFAEISNEVKLPDDAGGVIIASVEFAATYTRPYGGYAA